MNEKMVKYLRYIYLIENFGKYSGEKHFLNLIGPNSKLNDDAKYELEQILGDLNFCFPEYHFDDTNITYLANEKISSEWPDILQGLKNGIYNVNWTLADLEKIDPTNIYMEVFSRFTRPSLGCEMKMYDPLYFILSCAFDVENAVSMLSDFVSNGLYDPNYKSKYGNNVSMPLVLSRSREREYTNELSRLKLLHYIIINNKRLDINLRDANGNTIFHSLFCMLKHSYEELNDINELNIERLKMIDYLFRKDNHTVLDEENGNFFNWLTFMKKADILEINYMYNKLLTLEEMEKQISLSKLSDRLRRNLSAYTTFLKKNNCDNVIEQAENKGYIKK
jgi:hypothetical protein